MRRRPQSNEERTPAPQRETDLGTLGLLAHRCDRVACLVPSKHVLTPGVHASACLLGTKHATRHHTRRALTLPEILVVIAIIAILIAVIGLVGAGVRNKGRVSLTRQYMRTINAAIDDFHSEYGGYPWPPNDPFDDDGPGGVSTFDEPYEPTTDPSVDGDYYLGSSVSYVYPPSARFVDVSNASYPPNSDRDVTSTEGLYISLQICLDAVNLLKKLPGDAQRNEKPTTGVLRAAIFYDFDAGPPPNYYARRIPIGTGTPDANEFYDAWGHPIRYRLYQYRNNGRPILWSAGPDGVFVADPNNPDPGADDIFSDKE